MAIYFDCCFMKAEVFIGLRDVHQKNKELRFENFQKKFCHLQIEKYYFDRKSTQLKDFARKRNWKGDIKNSFLETFSTAEWEKLEEKEKHNINFCEACSIYKNNKNTFPNSTKQSVQKIHNSEKLDVNNPLKLSVNVEVPSGKNKQNYMNNIAENYWEDINNQWINIFNTPFAQIIPKLKSSNLVEKPSTSLNKQNQRLQHR